MSPTRVGEVLGLRVWRGRDGTESPTDTFLLQLRYSGLSDLRPVIDDDDVEAEYERLGLATELLGAFDEVAARYDGDG